MPEEKGAEPQKPKVLDSRIAFEGRKARVRVDNVEIAGGRQFERETVVHPGVAAMVPLDSDGCVIMVRQYRIAADRVLLEIPAGVMDPGEAPEETAQRELAEEIGMRAGMLTRLAEFYVSPGISDEVIHLFLAEDLSESLADADEDEDIALQKVPLSTALLMAQHGEFEDAKTLIGVLMACRVERLLK